MTQAMPLKETLVTTQERKTAASGHLVNLVLTKGLIIQKNFD
jgi:hypothetical protein